MTNVANPRFAYQTLGQGLSQVNSSFNRINFTSLDDAEFNGEGTPYQIVTTFQGGAWHSIFFNPDSAEEYDGTKSGFGPDVGIDYIAMTTSMTTQCTMATKDCNIDASNSNLTFDQNNISIPFHCYDGFSGDLGQTPATGHERAQGWNMSFYDVTDGSPRNILTQAQSNPFRFYVAAAVNSIDFQDLRDANYPATVDGSLVYVGGGFSAFALNCNATIYNVTFSLNNGSFYSFNTKQSFPQIASIIKAPLQVGFGQYHLYEAAKVAVLPNDRSIADTMGTAFSQTGMALASGAFDFNNTALARLRWTVTVTKVPKAPYWFLVMACLMYSVFGFIMTVVALFLRRMPAIQDQQARLMDQWAPAIKSALDEDEKEGTEGSRFLD